MGRYCEQVINPVCLFDGDKNVKIIRAAMGGGGKKEFTQTVCTCRGSDRYRVDFSDPLYPVRGAEGKRMSRFGQPGPKSTRN